MPPWSQALLKYCGVTGAVGGFVADVLQPIAPIGILAGATLLLTAIAILFTYQQKSALKTRALFRQILNSQEEPPLQVRCALFSGLLSILLLGTGFVSQRQPSSGVLAANIPGIASLQDTLLKLNKSTQELAGSVSSLSRQLSDVGKEGPLVKAATEPEELLNNFFVHVERGNYVAAKEAFERYVRTGARHIDAFESYSAVLASLHGRSAAMQMIESRVKDDAFWLLARCALFEDEERSRQLENAIANNPTDLSLRVAYCTHLGALGDYFTGATTLEELGDELLWSMKALSEQEKIASEAQASDPVFYRELQKEIIELKKDYGKILASYKQAIKPALQPMILTEPIANLPASDVERFFFKKAEQMALFNLSLDSRRSAQKNITSAQKQAEKAGLLEFWSSVK